LSRAAQRSEAAQHIMPEAAAANNGEIIPIQNVSQLRDELPQPYRMIEKVLEKFILDPAWDRISAKFPLTVKPPGIGEQRPMAKLVAPQTVFATQVYDGQLPSNVTSIMPSNCLGAPLLITTAGERSVHLLIDSGKSSSDAFAGSTDSDGGSRVPLLSVPLFADAAYEPFRLEGVGIMSEGYHYVPSAAAVGPRGFVVVAAATQSSEPTQASLDAREAHAEAAAAYAVAREKAIKADPVGGATATLVDVHDPGPQPDLVVLRRGAVEVVAVRVPPPTYAAPSAQQQQQPPPPRVLLRWMAPADKLVTALVLARSGRFVSVGLTDGTVHIFRVPVEKLGRDPAVAAAEDAAAAEAAAAAATAAADADAKKKAAKKKPASSPAKGKDTGKGGAGAKGGKAPPPVEERLLSLPPTRHPLVSLLAAVHTAAGAALLGEALVPLVAFLEEGPAPTPDAVRARQGGGATIVPAGQLALLSTPAVGGIRLPDGVDAVAFVGWEDQAELLRVELRDGADTAAAPVATPADVWNIVLPASLRALALNEPTNHALAAGLADGSTAVLSTAVPMSTMYLTQRKHAHPVSALAFTAPPPVPAAAAAADVLVVAEAPTAGSFLVSTSVRGGVIVYKLPASSSNAAATAEECVRVMEADGTAAPYVASVRGAPAALVGDDAPTVQLLDLTDGRPMANLLPSREDARSSDLESPVHACLTARNACVRGGACLSVGMCLRACVLWCCISYAPCPRRVVAEAFACAGG
jgi:hypothetical protein